LRHCVEGSALKYLAPVLPPLLLLSDLLVCVREAVEGFQGQAEAVGLDADCAAEGLVYFGDGQQGDS
jgi:hypothetical protein